MCLVLFSNRIDLLEKLGFFRCLLVSVTRAAAPLFAFPCFKVDHNKTEIYHSAISNTNI